jgi:putative Ca2+/H+ antiporter (TMEM165/GDT1 family)
MVLEARSMSSSHLTEEMREVEEELEHDTAAHDMSNPRGMAMPLEDLEEGSSTYRPGRSSHSGLASPRSISRAGSPSKKRSPSPKRPLSGSGHKVDSKKEAGSMMERMSEMARGALQTLVNPVFAQAFILTFLGEWGDRSQIATITMGGTHVSSEAYFDRL